MLVSVDLTRGELAGTPIHLTIVARVTASQEPGWPVVASLALQCITGFRLPTEGKSFDALGCKNESPLLEPCMEPRFEDRGGARWKHCVKHNGRCSRSTRIRTTGPLSTSAATRRHS